VGLSPLSPKYGRSLGTDSAGWNHTIYTATPGIPGDSGSGFLDASGKAFGVLSTVAIAPLAGSNGVGSLAKEIAYAQAHGISGLALVNGTEPFSGAL
jgi:S1-C subfamily serine protease